MIIYYTAILYTMCDAHSGILFYVYNMRCYFNVKYNMKTALHFAKFGNNTVKF